MPKHIAEKDSLMELERREVQARRGSLQVARASAFGECSRLLPLLIA